MYTLSFHKPAVTNSVVQFVKDYIQMISYYIKYILLAFTHLTLSMYPTTWNMT